MRVLISAAETSSDAHGAQLLLALRDGAGAGESIEAFGVGGPKLQAAGLDAVVDARELLAMGFSEVFERLPRIFRALRSVELAARDRRPDVAVVIDYPEFHFRLARRLRAQGVPVVYYIPPKVWVWRKRRVRVLKERFARVLSILPFETEFYAREGVPVSYVGNPLVDELPLSLTRAEARLRLGLREDDHVLAMLPGSRPSEIRQHVDLLLDAAVRGAALLRGRGALGAQERLVVLVPFPVTSDLASVRARVEGWLKRASGGTGLGDRFILDVRVSQGDAAECMVAADAGLIKSGTSTLEAALLGCPHAIVYKPNRLTEWLFKHVVRYRGPVGLSNLVANAGAERADGVSPGDLLVHEILCSDATVEAISVEIAELLGNPSRREELKQGLALVRARIVAGGESPSAAAAREVFRVVESERARAEPGARDG